MSIPLIFITLILISIFPTTSNAQIAVTDIIVSGPNSILGFGEASNYKVDIYPSNATNKTLVYGLSDYSLATIMPNQLLTTPDKPLVIETNSIPGVLVITAYSYPTLTVSGTITITIASGLPKPAVTDIVIANPWGTLDYTDNLGFALYLYPSSTPDTNVIYTTSNPNVLTITKNTFYNQFDILTNTLPGIVTITGTSVSHPLISGTIVVTVGSGMPVNVTNVSVFPSTTNIGTGRSFTFTTDILPVNATNTDVTWSVLPNTMGTISSDGTFYPSTTLGPVTITATSVYTSSVSGIAIVSVVSNVAVTSISISPLTQTVAGGGGRLFTANILPVTATDQSVIWNIYPSNIGTIDSDGVFTAGSIAGVLTIVANSVSDPMVEGRATVLVDSVNIGVTSISITDTLNHFTVGGSYNYTISVLPSNATNKSVTWTSSNTIVGVINNDGQFNALSEGVTSITAASISNPVFTDMIMVTVEVSSTSPGSYFISIVNSGSQTTFVNGNIIISWPTIAGASTYCLQYSTDSTFATNVVTVCGLTSPSYTISGLGSSSGRSEGQTIYWKVGAIDDATGSVYWSDVQNTARVLQVAAPISVDQLQLYPNPSSDLINISGLKTNDEVLIYDVHGSLVLKTNASSISISSLSNGIYVARINTRSLRFVKQ